MGTFKTLLAFRLPFVLRFTIKLKIIIKSSSTSTKTLKSHFFSNFAHDQSSSEPNSCVSEITLRPNNDPKQFEFQKLTSLMNLSMALGDPWNS